MNKHQKYLLCLPIKEFYYGKFKFDFTMSLSVWIDDVAVIDEIQMLRDMERGGAWTRVLLGLCAREIHLCGEEAAVNLVKRIVNTTGDTLEVYLINFLVIRNLVFVSKFCKRNGPSTVYFRLSEECIYLAVYSYPGILLKTA